MSISLLLALAGTVVALAGLILLAVRCARTPRTDLIGWTCAVFGIAAALAAQAAGFAIGFGPTAFRAVQLGAQVIAPLGLAVGLAEVAARSLPTRFAARLAVSALGVIGLVILATEPLGPAAFSKALPAASVYYQPISNSILMYGIAPFTALVALIALIVTAARSMRDPAWRATLPAVAAAGVAALALAAPGLSALAASKLGTHVSVTSAFTVICLLAAVLTWLAASMMSRIRLDVVHQADARARDGEDDWESSHSWTGADQAGDLGPLTDAGGRGRYAASSSQGRYSGDEGYGGYGGQSTDTGYASGGADPGYGQQGSGQQGYRRYGAASGYGASPAGDGYGAAPAGDRYGTAPAGDDRYRERGYREDGYGGAGLAGSSQDGLQFADGGYDGQADASRPSIWQPGGAGTGIAGAGIAGAGAARAGLAEPGMPPGPSGLLPDQSGVLAGPPDLLPDLSAMPPGPSGVLPGPAAMPAGSTGLLPVAPGMPAGPPGMPADGMLPGQAGLPAADDHEAWSMLFGQIAIYTLLEDRVHDFDNLTEMVVDQVRAREPDTLVYIVHAVPSAPMQRILYEVYRNREAYEEHKRQPYITKFEVDRRPYVLATNVIELGLQRAKVSPFPFLSDLLSHGDRPDGSGGGAGGAGWGAGAPGTAG